MPQTNFQKRIWQVAQMAHAATDRADARMLMRMNELVDVGDYDALRPMVEALQGRYRDPLGEIPVDRDQDGYGPEQSMGFSA